MNRRHIGTFLKVLPIVGFFVILLYLSQCNMSDNCRPCRETRDKPNGVQNHESHKEPSATSDYNKIKTFLVVMIMTGPHNTDRRTAIRQTWLSSYPEDILPRFVIGVAGLGDGERDVLQAEQMQYDDLLLLEELIDSYKSLTRKLLLMYSWLDQNVDFTFVLKADDDTFARLDILSEELRSMQPDRLCWGFFDGRAKAKKTTKWAEPDWKLCDHYLPYALGGGYVLSSDLVHYVARNMEYLKIYNNEDVSLGAWLASVDVNRIHDTRFDTEYRSRGCNNAYIVTHKQAPELMYEKHKQLVTHDRLCEQEVQVRKSYNYDWNKPPSQCCVREMGIP
ncbi:beta-1,3-galactosyltransferase 6-like [Ptychodera flava]|uniref:beta-1,3-galactosyltransferase 6-like n=1 Tax=Ptychodera flava TaxID=63121 RepID=UPI00396A8150